MRIVLAIICLAIVGLTAMAADRKGTRFWNLSSATIVKFQLSPAGQNAWGPNQCENDRDGEVDHDERLKIVGVTSGRYDLKLAYKDGRACIVKNVDVKDGGIFSIEDKDLTDCTK